MRILPSCRASGAGRDRQEAQAMPEINRPEILAEVTEAFGRYEAALTGNDVTTLDGLFWSSDHVVRYGATENLYGRDEILAFRKARPSRSEEHTSELQSLRRIS